MKTTKFSIRIPVLLSLIVIFYCNRCNVCCAQDNDLRKDIILMGNISDEAKLSFLANDPVLAFKEFNIGADPSIEASYNIKFIKNSFKLNIKPIGDLMYIRIPSFPIEILRLGTFLVQPGDSISLIIQGKDDLTIKSNSPLFNCQLELLKNRIFKINNNLEPAIQVKKLKSQRDSLLLATDAIISGFRNQVGDNLLQLVRLNSISETNKDFFTNLYYGFALPARTDEKAKEAAKKIINNDYLATKAITDTSLIRNSLFYAPYLLQLNKVWNAIHTMGTGLNTNNFAPTYRSITNHYSGVLKEKLLDCLFLTSMNTTKNSIDYLNFSISQVRDTLYKNILLSIKDASTEGVKAYPFSLPDNKDKIHSLKDFEGKVVFCEFWFYGCAGCVILQKDLRPWKVKYKDNPNIIFLSINTDLTKERWEKGLKTGLYNSNEDINLSTYGLGYSHPMLQFYHFIDFPQMVLIDSNGKVLSSHPERTTNIKEMYDHLDELIEKGTLMR